MNSELTAIELVTVIRAPIQACFDLSLDIDLEVRAARKYHVQPIRGITSGKIRLGERVTWKSRQFGIPVRHTSEITNLTRPYFFQDKMIRGVFRSFEHNHFFTEMDRDNTEMKDMLRFEMPFYALGVLSERTFVAARLKALIIARNEVIKRSAEESVAR